MKSYILKDKTIWLSENHIEYNGTKLIRRNIYDWHYYLWYVNGSGSAELKFKSPEGEIDISLNVNSFIFTSKASNNAIQQIEELMNKVLDNNIVQNFLIYAANKIKNEGKFKIAGVRFYNDKISCGLLFPLEVSYKNASITTSRFETTRSNKTGVYLNDGANDKETKISSHLPGTDIQKLNILVQYLPQFLN
ncbi:hypothetical protein [Rufibacter quisquiliarum]|uniref:Uncharacterized protein n=1 Tax=Rufibacter quisquiliarum TaxID=1549639 RepID=A0A839GWT4_9BACT|nr:hypothetical protein [Rufibacter quisquiliarum]MBA9079915.1 hypothetical protein [Rufibacter quisquiliarum]